MATWSSRKAAQAQRTCVNMNVDQRATAGWKATKVAERLVEPYMVRIETTSSYTSPATPATFDDGWSNSDPVTESEDDGQ